MALNRTFYIKIHLKIHTDPDLFLEWLIECNNNAVEDEIHFLCECPMYDDLRKLYFNFDWTNPPIDRTELFKQVLTDESAENTRVLGKFLKEAYLRRNSEMDIPQPTSC